MKRSSVEIPMPLRLKLDHKLSNAIFDLGVILSVGMIQHDDDDNEVSTSLRSRILLLHENITAMEDIYLIDHL
jgi:hypothetical protein